MMYIHYCKYCQRIHMLNGHKYYCPGCCGHLTELKISYLKYVNLDKAERIALKLCLSDSRQLQTLTASADKTQMSAKWLSNPQSNVKNYHADHYAAYSQ